METITAAATILTVLALTKMNGAGNDFILTDNRTGTSIWIALRLRAFVIVIEGIGGGRNLLLEKASKTMPTFACRYFNADEEKRMCGMAPAASPFANQSCRQEGKISFETPEA